MTRPLRNRRTFVLLLLALSGAAGCAARIHVSADARVKTRTPIEANASVTVVPTAEVSAGSGARGVPGQQTVITAGGGVGANITVKSGGVSSSFESSLISGMADFVVSRAREEVITYVVRVFGELLCEKGAKWDVSSYFRETCGLIVGHDSEGLSTRKMGSAFRVALAKDVARLAPTLLNSRLNSLFPDDLRDPNTALALLELVERLRCGDDPVALIVTMAPKIKCEEGRQAGCALRVVGLGMKSLQIAGNWDEVKALPEQRAELLARARVGFDEALANDPTTKAWADRRLAGDLRKKLIDKLAILAEDMSAEVAKEPPWSTCEEATWDVLPSRVLDATFVFVKGAIRAVMAPDEPGPVMVCGAEPVTWKEPAEAEEAVGLVATLEVAWHDLEEWVGIGRAVFGVMEGLWNGENPLGLAIGATKIVPCRGDDDVGCAFHVIGLAVQALQKLEWKNVKKPDDVKPAVEELARLVAETGDCHLQRWFNKYLGPDKRIEFTFRIYVASNNANEMQQRAQDVPVQETEKRREVGFELVGVSLDIWRAGLTATLASDDQARVLRLIDDLHAARTALAQGDPGGFMVALYAIGRDVGVPEPFPPMVRQYMPLMVDLLAAKESKDVVVALEKYAAPVGSWKRKRESDFSASLTAFFGATGGYENVASDGGAEVALFAPVGLDLTWGMGGMYFSILDLGTLTAARIEGDDVDTPNLSFAQVLSPGIFARIAPLDSPFVLGVGASLVPGLRTDPSTDEELLAWRIHAFAAVDVTILNF